jgi:UDP-N-acetylmuramoylalanine--D-glutamate ligase
VNPTAAESRPEKPQPESLTGKRVTVVGLGRFGGGLGVSRWLCRQQARVTVSDRAPAEELAESVRGLTSLEVTLHLGSHDERDFLEADLLVVNPAVPKDLPLLAAAEAVGVARTSEMNLFLQRCRAPVVGVTGTTGKSTTTAMTGAILTRRCKTHVGGNIGRSLLGQLENIAPHDAVVLEMSSFQLEDLPLIGIGPEVAVVTNFSPNHLDRHGSVEAYADAKKNIFRFQRAEDVLILNGACKATASWQAEAACRVEFFDPGAEPFELTIRGRHNQANAQAAWTAAKHFGVERESAAAALRDFEAMPHRLQLVKEIGGVRYYNDSKCTTPEGAVMALEAFEPRRVVAIVGGYDKGVSFDELGRALAERAKAVVATGATAEKIIAALERARSASAPKITVAASLAAAVRSAAEQSQSGDVVLLSPACASYDMFTNYRQRGETFVRIVNEL